MSQGAEQDKAYNNQCNVTITGVYFLEFFILNVLIAKKKQNDVRAQNAYLMCFKD